MKRKLLLSFSLITPLCAQTLFNLSPTTTDQLPNRSSIGLNLGLASRDSPSFENAFFFGDSLTDTGNAAFFLGTLQPAYPGTSLTNGLTWAEYLVPSVTPVSVLDPLTLESDGPIDFSIASSSTDNVRRLIGTLLPVTTANRAIQPNDLAFLWAGSNDFLAAYRSGTLGNTADTALSNLISSVDTLANTEGFQNIAVIGLFDLSRAPEFNGLTTPGPDPITNFNQNLLTSLRPFQNQTRLIWIDSFSFLEDIIAHPSQYGIAHLTTPAAPDAMDGIAPTVPADQQNDFLFYDQLHPTTGIHQQFATYVAQHFILEQSAADAHLITDAALILDDRFGFETHDLKASRTQVDFAISTYDNQSASHRRSTQSFRAGLDYGINDQLSLGAQIFYADGDTRRSTFDSFGFGLDSTSRGQLGQYQYELGLGLGILTGELNRDLPVGTFHAESDHFAGILTAHTALRNDHWKIGNMNAYWELGLKQRFVFRDDSSESGAASLNLHYQSDTLSSTLANIEMGLHFNDTFTLEIALNPILFHSGGDFSGSQRNGFAPFTVSDQSGYDVHTARATLHSRLSDSTSFSLNSVASSDQTWSTNLGYHLRF